MAKIFNLHDVFEAEISITVKLGPAYNEFGYNEQTAFTSRFPCIKINDRNVRLHRAPTYNFFTG